MNHSIDPMARPPAWIIWMLATAVGLIVANLYYAQPLVGPISKQLHMSSESAGMIVTLTQIGYGIGLLFIVPLADLMENRTLVIRVLIIALLALLVCTFTQTQAWFLSAAWMIGLGSVAVQILVPYAAHLAPPHMRGQVVGNVMSGLMIGIMFARPVASFITSISTWRWTFGISAMVMVAVMLLLRKTMPIRQPETRISYAKLISSLPGLVLQYPILRRRALYQACLFGSFSLFWTVSPLLLASPLFGLSQMGIALFALAGVAGAIAAPVSGRVADRGLGKPFSYVAMIIAICSYLITWLDQSGSWLSLAAMVTAAIMLDFSVTLNLVIGQRAIYGLSDEFRSRLNGIYMATFFTGGAIGSAVGVWAYAHGGWQTASWIGLGMPALALLLLFSDRTET
ncbi:MFS transporter [Gynuella sp.]|uniref:MFS transporter n=1 Tax=Gynuella sp. TaxID=2969146 RepID=UPI003D0BA49B